MPHTHALEGHSDADVGLHALTDALLGAIADGDIGKHFPPSDAQWKGARSEVFLADAARRVAAAGYEIGNVDVTLICEAPRIGPHRDAMRAEIARILGIDVARVGVKATTTETPRLHRAPRGHRGDGERDGAAPRLIPPTSNGQDRAITRSSAPLRCAAAAAAR